jgi:hypothetical protein
MEVKKIFVSRPHWMIPGQSFRSHSAHVIGKQSPRNTKAQAVIRWQRSKYSKLGFVYKMLHLGILVSQESEMRGQFEDSI